MTDLRPQSEGFSFYRIPKQLVKGREYRPLSPAGKLLFGLLLDRVSLSVKNGWRDGEGRTYVYYAVAEICEDFGCSRVTAGKLLSELERIGLIERKKQGQGKPDRIYVLQFCAKSDFLTSQKETSRLPLFRSLEAKKFYIKKPKTYALIRLIERN